jgi:uncharacterized HAD superfamily protein
VAYKLNLGFDIDGVISDFVGTFAKLVKKYYRVTMTEADVHCFDLGLVLGISKEERNKLVRETLQKNLALNVGARESLNKLHLAGHRVVLLTARSPDLGEVTADWLKRKRIPYSKLIQLDEGKKHLAKVSLDLVVEDNLENAIGWSEKVRNILIYDHPWNQSLNVRGLFKRVHNWNEIMKEIELLERSFS